MPVITDASSAILLEKAGLFTLTARFFQLVLPVSVFEEITCPGRTGAESFSQYHNSGIFSVQSARLNGSTNASLAGLNMGKGETEMIALYLEQIHRKAEGNFIMTDDGKAARWCFRKNLPFINALLVPKIFCYAGHINENESLNHMEKICHFGRYTPKIKDFAFGCSREDLSYFIPGNNIING